MSKTFPKIEIYEELMIGIKKDKMKGLVLKRQKES